MTWHLIATRTVHPTKKSAVEFCKEGKCPEILTSGSFDKCYERAKEFKCGVISPLLFARGNPVVKNNDWTYYIIQSPV